MKKIILLFISGIIALTLCSCSNSKSAPKTLNDAVAKADEIIFKLDKQGNGGMYMSDFDSDNGIYFVTTTSTDIADLTESAKLVAAEIAYEKVYEQLSDVFVNFDVSIATIALDENRQIICATLDGELIDLED